MPRTLTLTTSLAAAALLALGSASAQVSARQSVVTEAVVVGPDGQERIVREAAEQVIPGDRIAYVLAYENEGEEAAEALVLVMPVPDGVAVAIGAEEGGQAEYSVDGGRTYGAWGTLAVTETGGFRPARPADVTHLRWRLAEALAPGETGEVSYRGVLR